MNPLVEIEKSPNNRYVRYDSKLGEGSSKEVWRAFDTEKGIEVAWNSTNNICYDINNEDKINNEVAILKTLKHPNILTLYDYWKNESTGHTCFITDIMVGGTLHEFIYRIGNINLAIIKNWCKQILQALNYMHTQSPPIIHRDLKCDNIFIDSCTSILRIGDFGLSAIKKNPFLSSMRGTVPYMAPEIFEEKYTEKIDIYAFGMCLLEMITKRYPYEECMGNPIKLWQLLQTNTKPIILSSIKDVEIHSFIELCISPEATRPSANELLKHAFLNTNLSKDNSFINIENLVSVDNKNILHKTPNKDKDINMYDQTPEKDNCTPIKDKYTPSKINDKEDEVNKLEFKILSKWI